jgi:hypothetical protein
MLHTRGGACPGSCRRVGTCMHGSAGYIQRTRPGHETDTSMDMHVLQERARPEAPAIDPVSALSLACHDISNAYVPLAWHGSWCGVQHMACIQPGHACTGALPSSLLVSLPYLDQALCRTSPGSAAQRERPVNHCREQMWTQWPPALLCWVMGCRRLGQASPLLLHPHRCACCSRRTACAARGVEQD